MTIVTTASETQGRKIKEKISECYFKYLASFNALVKLILKQNQYMTIKYRTMLVRMCVTERVSVTVNQ